VLATVAQIPIGILVDKGRRRLAFILNITSTVLYWGSITIFGIAFFHVHLRCTRLTVAGLVRVFPLWCFYISPVFLLAGGGPWVTSSLVYATINNTVRPDQRYSSNTLIFERKILNRCQNHRFFVYGGTLGTFWSRRTTPL
jgi:hypothetical protein